MGKRGPCLPRKWSSRLGWVQNDCVSKQSVSMKESGVGAGDDNTRDSRQRVSRGRGGEGSLSTQIASWEYSLVLLLMVLLLLASPGIFVGPSGDHCPSVQCRPLPPALGNWRSPSFDWLYLVPNSKPTRVLDESPRLSIPTNGWQDYQDQPPAPMNQTMPPQGIKRTHRTIMCLLDLGFSRSHLCLLGFILAMFSFSIALLIHPSVFK